MMRFNAAMPLYVTHAGDYLKLDDGRDGFLLHIPREPTLDTLLDAWQQRATITTFAERLDAGAEHEHELADRLHEHARRGERTLGPAQVAVLLARNAQSIRAAAYLREGIGALLPRIPEQWPGSEVGDALRTLYTDSSIASSTLHVANDILAASEERLARDYQRPTLTPKPI